MTENSPRGVCRKLAVADDSTVLAAERSVRRILRGQYVGYTRDDLLQEGRLALWLARAGNKVPDEPEHARRYLARRASGAMLDSVRAARRQIPKYEKDAQELMIGSESDPTARLRMKDMIDRLVQKGSGTLLECVDMLVAGHEPKEVAQSLGVSESRVSQLRREARAIAGSW